MSHSRPVLGVPVMIGTVGVIRYSCGARTSSLQSRKSPYFCLTALLWLHVCVNIHCGRDPVCVPESDGFFGRGAVTVGRPSNPPSSQRTNTSWSNNKYKQDLFLTDTPFALPKWETFIFSVAHVLPPLWVSL